MKSARYFAFTLGAGLAACGGGGNGVSPLPKSVAPLIAAPSSTQPDTSPLRGEVFTASDVTVENNRCRFGVSTRFRAKGTTGGPYLGTFVASGKWRDVFAPPSPLRWLFSESFTITSGKHTISGTVVGGGSGFPSFITCTAFGPATKGAGLKYDAMIGKTIYSGPITVKDIATGSLGEMLHR